jgi:membrane protein implicated in regulation of membrane protease activity
MEKLLAIISLSQNIYGKWLIRKLVSGAIIIGIVAIITSVVTSAVVILAFYILYLFLLHLGLVPLVAISIVGIVGVLLSVLLILFITSFMRDLSSLPKQVMKKRMPQASQAGEVIDSFLSGLMGESSIRK